MPHPRRCCCCQPAGVVSASNTLLHFNDVEHCCAAIAVRPRDPGLKRSWSLAVGSCTMNTAVLLWYGLMLVPVCVLCCSRPHGV